MKRMLLLMILLCFLLAGCGSSEATPPADTTPVTEAETVPETTVAEETTVTAETAEPSFTVYPLPDTTMENLSDAILSVSLDENSAYIDETGTMQMALKIYSYDRYDMVDISLLKVGDTIVTHTGEVKITALVKAEDGAISINGGFEEDGFDLVTDDSGIFYERGLNDIKNWYEAGTATIRVSPDFVAYDRADLEQGEVILNPENFLSSELVIYDFTPYNTTVRVEAGQIVELERSYTP